MLAGAFALPGRSGQLQPNFPCAVFVFVFPPVAWAIVGDLSSGETRQLGLVASLSFRLRPILGHAQTRVNLTCVAWAAQRLPLDSGGFKQQGKPWGWTGHPKAPCHPSLPASLPSRTLQTPHTSLAPVLAAWRPAIASEEVFRCASEQVWFHTWALRRGCVVLYTG